MTNESLTLWLHERFAVRDDAAHRAIVNGLEALVGTETERCATVLRKSNMVGCDFLANAILKTVEPEPETPSVGDEHTVPIFPTGVDKVLGMLGVKERIEQKESGDTEALVHAERERCAAICAKAVESYKVPSWTSKTDRFSASGACAWLRNEILKPPEPTPTLSVLDEAIAALKTYDAEVGETLKHDTFLSNSDRDRWNNLYAARQLGSRAIERVEKEKS